MIPVTAMRNLYACALNDAVQSRPLSLERIILTDRVRRLVAGSDGPTIEGILATIGAHTPCPDIRRDADLIVHAGEIIVWRIKCPGGQRGLTVMLAEEYQGGQIRHQPPPTGYPALK